MKKLCVFVAVALFILWLQAETATQTITHTAGVSTAAECPPFANVDWSRTSVGLTPLNDLGSSFYQGKQGGLYPGGANVRPAAHEAAGVALARSIEPLNANGNPDPNGKYVLLSIGMSNTSLEFSAFKAAADVDPAKDPHLVIVNGAQGGQDARKWAEQDLNSGEPWGTLNGFLSRASVTPAQVVVVWIKQANGFPKGAFPADAELLQSYLVMIAQRLKVKFPNLKLAYFSSRIYAGYSTTNQQPEAYAYEEGFGMKWLIEDQSNGAPAVNYDPAKGAVRAPWFSWGPYLWADGLTPRSDGLTWTCQDYIRTDSQPTDAIHPGEAGRRKVANLLLGFFKSDSTARLWFLPSGAGSLASVSAASFSGSALAPEAIVASFGSNLATTMQSATILPLPTTLAGTSVKAHDSAGSERLAPLFFVSPTQINYQMPAGTAVGAATITITSGEGSVAQGNAQISNVAPGLFTANASGQGVAAAVALRIRAVGTQSYEPVARFDSAQNQFVAVPIDLGPDLGNASDQVFLILFGTGLRYRSSLSAMFASLGGVDCQVTYAGEQGGFVGLDQVNVRLSRSLIGRGELDVALIADGQAANAVKANIK